MIVINGVTVDLGNEMLRDAAGNSIALRAQCFAVLRHLNAHPGELVTKDELAAAVWPGVAVTDDSLVQCVHEIRRALGDDRHAILQTVPKRGYRLVLPADAAPAAASAVTSDSPIRRASFAAPALALAALILLALASAFLWLDREALTKVAERAPSIAVLPFDNLGEDPSQSYFADGITEDLITDLSRVPGILVIARNSVWTYKGKVAPPEVVARELGVRYVLDGSVRRQGDRVRINAQLIDTLGDHHLWADRYDGSVSDVFALQDRVIGNIVAALSVNLPGANSADAAETVDPQAYDAFLLGMERLHLDTDEDTLKAVALFERAVAIDPDYRRAYAAIAAAQLRIVLSGWRTTEGAELDAAHASLRVNLEKAMLRPTSLAYTVAAEVARQSGRNDEALALIDQARAMAPNDPEVLVREAWIMNATGRAAEAEAALRLAMRLDPKFAPSTLRALSVALFEQEKYWETIELVGRIKAQDAATTDDYITLVSSLGHLGVSEGVAAAIDRYAALALTAGRDALSVQEAQWRWHGELFNYHRPFVERLVEGLRKAGVAEGAGTDLSLDHYMALISRRPDGRFDVKGAPELPALTAGTLFDRGETFIDVRAPAGYASGHVPYAINLSLVSTLSREELMRVVTPDEPVVFYCHSRYCAYTAIAAAKAVLWGYKKVYRLAGGIPAWEEANCPIEVALKE